VKQTLFKPIDPHTFSTWQSGSPCENVSAYRPGWPSQATFPIETTMFREVRLLCRANCAASTTVALADRIASKGLA
jgi:hypothetical protein